MSAFSSRAWLTVAACLFAFGCNDDDNPPTSPAEVPDTFEGVKAILQADCAGCHGATSGRSFIAAMDSAGLVGSGFIDPNEPGQSLLLLKTRATAHGGGVINAFSSSDSMAVASWIRKQPATGATQLVAYRTTSVPGPDGFDSEDAWRNAKWLATRIGGGWADASEMYIKALYDNTNLYLFLRWSDDAASYRRQPFVKLANGTWRKTAAKPLPLDGIDWQKYMGEAFEEEGANFLYEDKLAIAWNTYGATTSPAFEQSGCAGLCHDPAKNGAPGTGYYYSDQKRAAKKFTNAPSEIVDLWHWKLVRQNDVGKMDDQYVRHWTIGDVGAAEGGRASDAGASGYADNPALVDGRPTYRGKSILPGLFSFPRADTIRLTAAELDALPVGSLVASMMTSPLSGQRADIDARGYYNANTKIWQYEIRRKLVTGDDKDVQFNNLNREYKFGVAVFDNAQIEHSWSPAVLRLVFKQ